MSQDAFRCGTVALIGRPNVGKSTLLNALLGQKLSITSNKPQTTRHRIRGILTTADTQYVFVDTPGFQTHHRSALNRMMNRGVGRARGGRCPAAGSRGRSGRCGGAGAAETRAGKRAAAAGGQQDRPDRTREGCCPIFRKRFGQPICRDRSGECRAPTRPEGTAAHDQRGFLPEQQAVYGEDQVTDRNERFLAAELIREKLFRLLGDELPYGSGVVIEKFEQTPRLRRIHALIVVDKEGHKPIVIGSGGEAEGDRQRCPARHGEAVRRQGLSRGLGQGTPRLDRRHGEPEAVRL